MSFYNDLISYDPPAGTDPLKPFRANLGQAENLFAEGVERHGESMILAVATFATLIHKGFKVGSLTFNRDTAIGMARRLYNRLPRFDADGTTSLPTMTEAVYNNWAKDIPPFFYPFSCNGRTLTPNVIRSKALANFQAMTPPEGMTKDNYTAHVLDCLDATRDARARCKRHFELACLVVARDPDNIRLPQYHRELGLLVLEADLMPVKKLENNSIVTYVPSNDIMDHEGKPLSTIRIPAVAKRQQFATGMGRHATEKPGPGEFRATLKQLQRAAITPPDHEAGVSRLIEARDALREFLTPAKATKTTADEDVLITELRTLIASHDDRVKSAADKTKENREAAALSVVQRGKVSKAAARVEGPGYDHKDKDGKAITEAALKTA